MEGSSRSIARGLVLLLSVVSGAACESADARRLWKLEISLSADVARLKMMGNDREYTRAWIAQTHEKLAAFQEELRLAEDFLDTVGRRSGFAPSGRDRTSREVRFSRSGPAPESLERLAALELPRGARVRWVRCDAEGCAFALRTLVPVDRVREGLPVREEFCGGRPPERPWWPPHAARWDRVRELQAQCEQLRGTLPEATGVKQLGSDVQFLLAALARDERSPAIVAAAVAAGGAGAQSFEVTWSGGGVRLSIPDASVELAARLTRRGLVLTPDGAWTTERKSGLELLRSESLKAPIRESSE